MHTVCYCLAAIAIHIGAAPDTGHYRSIHFRRGATADRDVLRHSDAWPLSAEETLRLGLSDSFAEGGCHMTNDNVGACDAFPRASTVCQNAYLCWFVRE